MTLYCISDLHLGDRGYRDTFAMRGEQRLLNFLNYVQSECGRVYVLGDLIDTWTTNMSAAIVAYRALLLRLMQMDARWIVGNHDNAFTAFLDQPGYKRYCPPDMPLPQTAFELEVGGRRIALCHGHESDPTCCGLNPGVGPITAIISGLLEDRNRGPKCHGHVIEDSWIGTLEEALNLYRHLSFQSDRRNELIDGMEKYRCERADVLVYGHTHEQGRIGDYHYNCGSWCRDRDGFTRIDEDGSVSMWTWDYDHATPFDKELR